jgi:hypothetical protein
MTRIDASTSTSFQQKVEIGFYSLTRKSSELNIMERYELSEWEKLIFSQKIQEQIEGLYTCQDINSLRIIINDLIEFLQNFHDNTSSSFSILTLLENLQERRKLLNKLTKMESLISSTPSSELLIELEKQLKKYPSLECNYTNIALIVEECFCRLKTRISEIKHIRPVDMKYWDSISSFISNDIKKKVEYIYTTKDMSILSSINFLLDYLDNLMLEVDCQSDQFMEINFLNSNLRNHRKILVKLEEILKSLKSPISRDGQGLEVLKNRLSSARKEIALLKPETANIQAILDASSKELEKAAEITCELVEFQTTISNNPSVKDLLLIQRRTNEIIKLKSNFHGYFDVLEFEASKFYQRASTALKEFKESIQVAIKYFYQNIANLTSENNFLNFEGIITELSKKLSSVKMESEFANELSMVAKVKTIINRIKPKLLIFFQLTKISSFEGSVDEIDSSLNRFLDQDEITLNELTLSKTEFDRIQAQSNELYKDLKFDHDGYFSEYAFNRLLNELIFYSNNEDLWEDFKKIIEVEITELKYSDSQDVSKSPEKTIEEINKTPKLLSRVTQAKILKKLGYN